MVDYNTLARQLATSEEYIEYLMAERETFIRDLNNIMPEEHDKRLAASSVIVYLNKRLDKLQEIRGNDRQGSKGRRNS